MTRYIVMYNVEPLEVQKIFTVLLKAFADAELIVTDKEFAGIANTCTVHKFEIADTEVDFALRDICTTYDITYCDSLDADTKERINRNQYTVPDGFYDDATHFVVMRGEIKVMPEHLQHYGIDGWASYSYILTDKDLQSTVHGILMPGKCILYTDRNSEAFNPELITSKFLRSACTECRRTYDTPIVEVFTGLRKDNETGEFLPAKSLGTFRAEY